MPYSVLLVFMAAYFEGSVTCRAFAFSSSSLRIQTK
jgi:hypothetical protein